MPAIHPRSSPRTLILMGVCGCGKTEVGKRMAARLGGVFEDADDVHSAENKAKMRQGTPLTDADRHPWYQRLRERILEMRSLTPVYVLACSALKADYRRRLKAEDDQETIAFVHLKGSRELIFTRMSARQGHYMPVSLLDSQFAILEETPDLVNVSIDATPEEIAETAINAVQATA